MTTWSPPGSDSESNVIRDVSCVECRRLKRKCNRTLPCELCVRYNRECNYVSAGRPSKQYTKDLEDRLERMERALQSQTSHYGPAPGTAIPEGQGATSVPGSHGTSRLYNEPALDSGSSQQVRDSATERTRHNVRQSRVADPISGPSRTDVALDWTAMPSKSPMSQSSVAHPSNPSPVSNVYSNLSLPPRVLSVRASSVAHPTSISNAQASEVLETQPSTASGYEWSERYSTTSNRSHDGYASMTMKPDGQGYFGFASGSTLLRILQICAGSLNVYDTASVTIMSAPSPGWKPASTMMDESVNNYFEHYHPQYPLIHEPTFRAQWMDIIDRPTAREWHLLTHVVMALGAYSNSQPSYVVDYFLEAAVSSLTAEHLETGSLTLVQAYCLLANISQKCNKPNSGSVYMGIAMRLAIGLGLHRELPFWNINPFEREVRRRIWWTCVAFDAGSAITFGRPILEPSYPESDVRMVCNVHDSEFTPRATSSPIEVDEHTLYTALIWHASFHVQTNSIYTRIMSAPPLTGEESLALDAELVDWYLTIPSYLEAYPKPGVTHWQRFGQYKMKWRYLNLRIILHRRVFLERALRRLSSADVNEASIDSKCSGLCMDSASESIESIQEFFVNCVDIPSRLASWYGLHFLFHSSFIPLIAIHTDPQSSKRAVWEQQVEKARAILQSFHYDTLAEKCLRIVDLLAPKMDAQTKADVDSNAWLQEFLQSSSTSGAVSQQDPNWPSNFLPYADLGTLTTLWPGETFN